MSFQRWRRCIVLKPESEFATRSTLLRRGCLNDETFLGYHSRTNRLEHFHIDLSDQSGDFSPRSSGDIRTPTTALLHQHLISFVLASVIDRKDALSSKSVDCAHLHQHFSFVSILGWRSYGRTELEDLHGGIGA